MDNSPKIIESKKFYMRAFDDDGKTWFVAEDIFNALGYSETNIPAQAIQSVPENWKCIKQIDKKSENDVLQPHDMLCLTENGVYSFFSMLQQA